MAGLLQVALAQALSLPLSLPGGAKVSLPPPPHSLSLHLAVSPQTQNLQLSKEMTLASNRSLAEGNLLFLPRLDALKARLTQRYQELQGLFETYQLKKTKLGEASGKGQLAGCGGIGIGVLCGPWRWPVSLLSASWWGHPMSGV